MEDAEALLADRSAGNRGAIANLLNIADGLLGDWLQMQLALSAIARQSRSLKTMLRWRMDSASADAVRDMEVDRHLTGFTTTRFCAVKWLS